jgi:hypothetical protein
MNMAENDDIFGDDNDNVIDNEFDNEFDLQNELMNAHAAMIPQRIHFLASISLDMSRGAPTGTFLDILKSYQRQQLFYVSENHFLGNPIPMIHQFTRQLYFPVASCSTADFLRELRLYFMEFLDGANRSHMRLGPHYIASSTMRRAPATAMAAAAKRSWRSNGFASQDHLKMTINQQNIDKRIFFLETRLREYEPIVHRGPPRGPLSSPEMALSLLDRIEAFRAHRDELDDYTQALEIVHQSLNELETLRARKHVVDFQIQWVEQMFSRYLTPSLPTLTLSSSQRSAAVASILKQNHTFQELFHRMPADVVGLVRSFVGDPFLETIRQMEITAKYAHNITAIRKRLDTWTVYQLRCFSKHLIFYGAVIDRHHQLLFATAENDATRTLWKNVILERFASPFHLHRSFEIVKLIAFPPRPAITTTTTTTTTMTTMTSHSISV